MRRTPSRISTSAKRLTTLAGEAGGDFGVGAEPAVSRGRHRRLSARGLPRRSRERSGGRHPPVPRSGRRQRADRFHGRAALAEARSERRRCSTVRRAEQPRARPLFARGAAAHRRAHVPGRRSRLDAQCGRRLRRLAAGALPTARRAVLSCSWRASAIRSACSGSCAITVRRTGRVRRRDRSDQPDHRDAGAGARTRAARRRVHSAASLGTTDDCGFSPFADDASTSRDIAFAKIRARVEGTRLAESALGVR